MIKRSSTSQVRTGACRCVGVRHPQDMKKSKMVRVGGKWWGYLALGTWLAESQHSHVLSLNPLEAENVSRCGGGPAWRLINQ